MEEVAAVRRAALEAVDGVEPGRLRERIVGRIEDGSMAPGVLTLLSARAAAERVPDPSGDTVPREAITGRGAGVQLIYEGLRLTRSLSQDPPWGREGAEAGLTDGGDLALSNGDGDPTKVDANTAGSLPQDSIVDADVAEADADDADMAILVADVMVARGFYLLARTEAAATAVRTVQSFGRDQTVRRTTGDAALDRNLEADVFELAVVAGTTAVGGAAPDSLREYVTDLARTDGGSDAPLSLAETLFSDSTVETLSDHLGDAGVATSADD